MNLGLIQLAPHLSGLAVLGHPLVLLVAGGDQLRLRSGARTMRLLVLRDRRRTLDAVVRRLEAARAVAVPAATA